MRTICLYFLLSCLMCRLVFASEKAVLNHIFDDYDVRIRPVKNSSHPVVVQAQLIIIRLIEVNAQQEYIKLSLAVDQFWKDEFLHWDPVDYNGTKFVSVPTSAIWIPDTVIITTSAEPENIINLDRQMVKLWYDGAIELSSPCVLTNYCPMQTDEFPYDQQSCKIQISSWIYTAAELSFVLLPNLTSSNVQYRNSEWNIEPYTGKTGDFKQGGDVFSQLFFTLIIKRKPAYYVWVLIIPTFIITALSIAGIFAPVNNIGDRQEKITLGLTTLLTLAVILSMVTGEMPRTTRLPLLGSFVLVEIIIIVICMAISVVILFLHQRSTTRPWAVPNILEIFLCDAGEKRDKIKVFVPFSHPPTARNVHGKEKNANNGEKPRENAGNFEENAVKLDDAINKVIGFIEFKKKETKAQEDEENRKHQWLILFDHVDLILFATFQVVHAVLYVTFFNR